MHRIAGLVATVLIAIAGTGCCTPPGGRAPLEVAYTANEGFLIRTDSRKILIDALFCDETIEYCDVPSAALRERMARGQEPFDDVDVVLVTHDHRDHFDAALAAQHLRCNPRAVLVCPQQAADRMRAECAGFERIAARVRGLDPGLNGSAFLNVNGIDVEAFGMRHAPYMVVDEETGEKYDRHRNVRNLAFLAGLDGRRILHVGDAALSVNDELVRSLRLAEREIDVVFLEFFDSSPETAALLDKHVRPKSIVFMHLPVGAAMRERIKLKLADDIPGAVLFDAPLEARSF